MVESQPSKLLVAGSIPVSRSRVEAFCGREAEHGEAGSPQPKSRAERGDWAMDFEQATIKVVKEREFGELKGAIERVFGADRIEKYLKALAGRGIRARSLDAILAANVIDLVAESKTGTGRLLYESLPVSDQGQVREFYLSKVEEVAPALRAKFHKAYQYS